MAAYVESGGAFHLVQLGSCKLWKGCRKVAETWLANPRRMPKEKQGAAFSETVMYRVINGSLFYDWPWGRERYVCLYVQCIHVCMYHAVMPVSCMHYAVCGHV
jgi:hypothetical protein